MNGLTSPAPEQPRIKRPIVSDTDGTREGGLVFPIVFILGFVAATVAHPGALTSFWVWFALLMMCVAVSVGVQKAVARLYGHEEEDDA
mmetsp:Transcript_18145/g.28237  ORF Transcript_18145/g.28237 Transcript_18145/m.28237 type:complete len:88 (+) Transcript_18145:5125-5388(+)